VIKVMAVACTACLSFSCGVIGAPIAPEDVGVAPLIERQTRRDAMDAKQREAEESPDPFEPLRQDVDLPPLQPVGTR
jgi:hypothetical protein